MTDKENIKIGDLVRLSFHSINLYGIVCNIKTFTEIMEDYGIYWFHSQTIKYHILPYIKKVS